MISTQDASTYSELDPYYYYIFLLSTSGIPDKIVKFVPMMYHLTNMTTKHIKWKHLLHTWWIYVLKIKNTSSFKKIRPYIKFKESINIYLYRWGCLNYRNKKKLAKHQKKKKTTIIWRINLLSLPHDFLARPCSRRQLDNINKKKNCKTLINHSRIAFYIRSLINLNKFRKQNSSFSIRKEAKKRTPQFLHVFFVSYFELVFYIYWNVNCIQFVSSQLIATFFVYSFEILFET